MISILLNCSSSSNSYIGSLNSLTTLHTESINVHTHLIGASLFASQLVRELLTSPTSAAPLLPFLISAITCLSASSAFHLFSNHSAVVAANLNQVDFACISLLIWGSFVSSLYYGFTCDAHLRNAYIAMITTIGLTCFYVSLKPNFRTSIWRPFRSSMFAAMGLSAVFPVLHGTWSYGLSNLADMIALKWLVLQGALYLIGASIYAMRVPERWYPGKCDVFGQSHQIFHVLVVAAACCHFQGLLIAREATLGLAEIRGCQDVYWTPPEPIIHTCF